MFLKKRVLRPFQEFAALEASGGILLFACAVVALLWANSPFRSAYETLWLTKLSVFVGDAGLSKPLFLWVNDGLMAVFFFVVGLEIKRELLTGELKSPRQAALPLAAALGGMFVPAGIYAALNAGTPGAAGWGIPMATDIAFALGVLSLLGSRAPLALKIFLTALAIIDDLGAVLVIAFFYTAEISAKSLSLAAGLLAVLFLLNSAGFRNGGVYAFVGFWLWLAILKSGVHATIAGVLIALTIPADQDPEEEAESSSLLYRLEHALHPWVTFLILPLFALANAGVVLSGEAFSRLVQPVSLGVFFGLVVGKPVGIFLFTWLAVRAKLTLLPAGVSWGHILGAGMLAGIGFTMSLFINALAFGESEFNAMAKMSILLASAVSAIVGSLTLLLAAPARESAAGSDM
jgi:NhaA family Na+:H+ antiporter